AGEEIRRCAHRARDLRLGTHRGHRRVFRAPSGLANVADVGPADGSARTVRRGLSLPIVAALALLTWTKSPPTSSSSRGPSVSTAASTKSTLEEGIVNVCHRFRRRAREPAPLQVGTCA